MLQTWNFENPEEPCIIVGDFNMSCSPLNSFLKRQNTGFRFMEYNGRDKTFFSSGNRTWYSLKHVIITKAAITDLDDSEMDVDGMAEDFVETSMNVAEKLSLFKTRNLKPNRFFLPRGIRREIKEKDLSGDKWLDSRKSGNSAFSGKDAVPRFLSQEKDSKKEQSGFQ
ncbi:hypothetical protein AYI68_g7642 [Smittium mucronatum]|uniref:Endonuclease/exonuclease/phosphatase domain-containing protein n=1 Tax=Smittium mucronatum TaxID=133383 RepID=A0A1R0GN37_9FUNG|nr:hypothetical protein AYI68_g7642 [Smittium mucronatum]